MSLPKTSNELLLYFQPPPIKEANGAEPVIDAMLVDDAQRILTATLERKSLDYFPPRESYHLALHVAQSTGDHRFVRRVQALVTLQFVEALLDEPADTQISVLKDVLKGIKDHDGILSVPITSYLDLPRRVPEPLLFRYQEPVEGRIMLGPEQLSILATHQMMQKYKVAALSKVPAWFKAQSGNLRAPITRALAAEKRRITADRKLGTGHRGEYPPCMNWYLARIERGENINHQERYNLVSFLGFFGMSTDDIVDKFQNIKGFNRRTTEYQVNHILRGGEDDEDYHGYYTMNCMQMRDLNICPSQTCKGPTPILRYTNDVRFAKRKKGHKPTKKPLKA